MNSFTTLATLLAKCGLGFIFVNPHASNRRVIRSGRKDLQHIDCIIVSAGLDWITLSSASRDSKRRYWRYYNGILADDLKNGYQPVRSSLYGFVGQRTRHAFHGEKQERMLLQVSGARAQRGIMLFRQHDSCARIDIQLTVRIAPGAVNRWLDAAYDVAQNWRGTRGKKVDVTYRGGIDGKETVYIGSKKSDILIRLYDKFRESRDEQYRDCVRLEVQLRKKPAQAIFDYVCENGLGTRYLCQVLCWYLARRGISTDWIKDNWSYVRPPKPDTPKESVTLSWLDTQVRKVVTRLSAEWGWTRIFRILFAEACTPHEMRAILAFGDLHTGNYAETG